MMPFRKSTLAQRDEIDREGAGFVQARPTTASTGLSTVQQQAYVSVLDELFDGHISKVDSRNALMLFGSVASAALYLTQRQPQLTVFANLNPGLRKQLPSDLREEVAWVQSKLGAWITMPDHDMVKPIYHFCRRQISRSASFGTKRPF